MAPSKLPSGKRNDSTKVFKSSKKPFKKTKDDVAARSEAMALQLEDVPDFPRGLYNEFLDVMNRNFVDVFELVLLGGGTSLSKTERKKIYEEVDAEFEAEERVSKRSKGGKPNKKRNPSEVDELGSLFDGGLTGKRPRYANKITVKVPSS